MASRPTIALGDLLALTKPRVTALVLVTTGGGMWLARGRLGLLPAIATLTGTGLAVAAANTLNCWLERDVDARMERTRCRPLPAGRLTPSAALYFGLALGILALPLVVIASNFLTGLLCALALVSYVAVYTPLKLYSPKALLVGAVSGALPPLIGWTSVTGRLEPGGLALFLILLLWQLPHFIAISIRRADDYARAGIQTTPVVRGMRAAKVHALLWTVALLPATLAPWALDIAGAGYLAVALILGGSLMAWTVAGFGRGDDVAWGRRLFRGSLFYLTLLFAALAVFAR